MNDDRLRALIDELDNWLLRLKRELSDREGHEKPMTIPWNEVRSDPFKNEHGH